MKTNLEIGDALLRCSVLLRQLASELPDCRVAIEINGRELSVTIYPKTRDGWRFVYRLQPGELPEYDREQLSLLWAASLRKLGLAEAENQK